MEGTTLIIVALLIVLVSLWLSFSKSSLKGLPGPWTNGLPIIGRTLLELGEQFNLSKFLKRWVHQGGVPKVPKSGRPRPTSRLFDRNVLRLSRVNPHLTAVDIARQLCDPTNPKPSVRTIRRRLETAGLHGRRPVKKPMISTKNGKARVTWAKVHKDWTKKEWEDVLWSDESNYMLFGTDGIQFIRRPQGTRFDPKY
ncbi:Transposable element Tcb1 transposase [Araneus ventricosus]|uniref:Transposable element Tcb1 transposase n=1 Tax=Araneus ventricosus TaxID=182803 RepID=A0A4Y2FIG8_ARAVE|nr:Transposable element Tcb1 transposase [Araneus ventricosus]